MGVTGHREKAPLGEDQAPGTLSEQQLHKNLSKDGQAARPHVSTFQLSLCI
jgi:hypothetical protein